MFMMPNGPVSSAERLAWPKEWFDIGVEWYTYAAFAGSKFMWDALTIVRIMGTSESGYSVSMDKRRIQRHRRRICDSFIMARRVGEDGLLLPFGDPIRYSGYETWRAAGEASGPGVRPLGYEGGNHYHQNLLIPVSQCVGKIGVLQQGEFLGKGF